ncbi:ecdysis triggering hormone isoform X2 [Cardiocondyla obscurior]|uniref:ecdysis triggering hormone isoform X2 n=1 Tax=Cardiocondyla obscurior TaxID=286306 RepID=UPI0039656F64
MTLQRTRRVQSFFFNIFLVGAIALLVCENTTLAEEVPAFFLKIAKIPTLPRVGRSGRFEDFFYKAEKHIPRIGRSNQQSINPTSLLDGHETFSDVTKRRISYSPRGTLKCSFIHDQIILAGFQFSNYFLLLVEEWTWQNFPLAIYGPKELTRTLAGYSSDDSDDIENEVWERKKRTGNELATASAK